MKNIFITCCLLLLNFTYAQAQWQSLVNTEGVILDEKREFLRAKDSTIIFKSDDYLYLSFDYGEHWFRRDIPFIKPVNFSVTPNDFDIKLTNKGIYLFHRHLPFNPASTAPPTFMIHDIYYSSDKGQSWNQFQDTSIINYYHIQTTADDKELYYYFNTLIDNGNNNFTRSYELFRCKVGENLWTRDRRFPEDLTSIKITNNRIVYTHNSKALYGDTIVLANRLTLDTIATKFVEEGTFIKDVTDSLVLVDPIYNVNNENNNTLSVAYDLTRLNIINISFLEFSSEKPLGKAINGTRIFAYYKDKIMVKDNYNQPAAPFPYDYPNQDIINQWVESDSVLYIFTGYDNVYRLKKGETAWKKCNTATIPLRLFKGTDIKKIFDNGVITNISRSINPIIGNQIHYYQVSFGNGLKWENIPVAPSYGNSYYYWIKDNLLYVSFYFGGWKVYKLSSFNGIWEETTLPYSQQIKGALHFEFAGDTLIFTKNDDFTNLPVIAVSVPPYDNNSVKTIATDLFVRESISNGVSYPQNFIFHYEGGILYYPTETFGMVRKNLSGNNVSNITFPYLPSFISNIYFDKQKIFYKYRNIIY
jgi:hypothetical protein